MTRLARHLIVALLALALLPSAMAQEREPLVVFAAASLTDALQAASDAFTKKSGTPVKLSFAASSALAKQIESGARADVFFPADQQWMDYLEQKQLIRRESRTDLLGNRLVLIAPQDSKVALKLVPGTQIAPALGKAGRLATGDPDSVPVGIYAKAALTSLGQWAALEPRLVRAENVRVALMYVARGEAGLGIVYATDARAETRVKVLDLFPQSSHPPITYPVALTSTAKPAAEAYLQFLRGPEAKAIFAAAGFDVLSAGSPAQACVGFKFDVSREMKLLGGSSTAIAAANSGKDAPAIRRGHAYEISLASQDKVKFVRPPRKATVNEGSYAGVVKLAPTAAKTLRVSISEAAWIDVIDGGRVVESSRHTGSHYCPSLRKSVEFDVAPNRPLLIQLSGSTGKDVRLVAS